MQERIKEVNSNAVETRALFKKYRGLWKSYYKLAPFTEPVALLIQKSGVRFFDNATPGKFQYIHSTGTSRSILLNEQKLLTFKYGKGTFKGYILHEDHPTPLPHNPILTAEEVNIAVEKTLHDIRKWKTDELKAWTGLWWKIALGIVAIILAYAVFLILKPETPPDPAPVIAAVQTI